MHGNRGDRRRQQKLISANRGFHVYFVIKHGQTKVKKTRSLLRNLNKNSSMVIPCINIHFTVKSCLIAEFLFKFFSHPCILLGCFLLCCQRLLIFFVRNEVRQICFHVKNFFCVASRRNGGRRFRLRRHYIDGSIETHKLFPMQIFWLMFLRHST